MKKMNRYIAYCCEHQYGGLHGMNSIYLWHAEKEEDLYSDAAEASREVIDSYNFLYHELQEEAEANDYDIDDLIDENIEYQIFKVRDDCALTDSQLEIEIACHDIETLVEEYCEKGE